MDDAKTVVQKYLQALREGNTDKIEQLLDDGVVWHVPGDMQVSTAGLGRGKPYVRAWIESLVTTFVPKEVRIKGIILNPVQSGDEVFVTGRFRHQHATTERYFSSDFIMQFNVKNGKITRYQIFEDSDLIRKAADKTYGWHKSSVRLNGTNYGFTDTGSGEPILFVHGLFIDSCIFKHQASQLSETHRCINFDLPMKGDNGVPPQEGHLENATTNLALFIEENRLENLTIAGESQGGIIGLGLAAKIPHLVKRLILIGTTGQSGPASKSSFYSNSENTAEATTQYHKDYSNLLPSISAKTLVLVGADDHIHQREYTAELSASIKQSCFQFIEGATGNPSIEQLEATLKIIKQFLVTTDIPSIST